MLSWIRGVLAKTDQGASRRELDRAPLRSHSTPAARKVDRESLPRPNDHPAESQVISIRLRVPQTPSGHRSCAARKKPLADTVTLRQAGLGTPRQRRRLAALGVHTLGDLRPAHIEQICRSGLLPRGAARQIARWRAAVRLQRDVAPLSLRDARLLVAVRCRSCRDLATVPVGRLQTAVRRYALSSPGQRLLGERRPPSRERLQSWIDSAHARHADDLCR
jgi:hypothetical protein